MVINNTQERNKSGFLTINAIKARNTNQTTNLDPITYNSRYPGFDETNYRKLESKVDQLGLTGYEKEQAMDELYLKALPIVQNNIKNSDRRKIINQNSYEVSQIADKSARTMAKSQMGVVELTQQLKEKFNIDPTTSDEDVFNSWISSIPDGEQLLVNYLNDGDKTLLYEGGLDTSPNDIKQKLKDNFWDELWANIKTKASVPIDNMKKRGQRTYNEASEKIYRNILKNTVGDSIIGQMGINLDDYVDTVTDKTVKPALMQDTLDYQNKINQRYAAREQKNLDQDIKNYYDNKGYTKLLKEGDLRGFALKTVGDAAQNREMPIVVAASVFQPEIGLGLMATDTYARENQEAYENMLNNGATYDEAEQGAVVVGLINSAVEVGLEKLIGGVETGASDAIRKTFMKNVSEEATKKGLGRVILEGVGSQLKASGEEGLEEIVQQIVQNAAVRTVNENQGLFEGVSQAFEGGFYNPMNLLAGGGNIMSNTDMNQVRQSMMDGAYNAGQVARNITDKAGITKDGNTNTQGGVAVEGSEMVTEKIDKPGVIDRITDWGAEKITNTVSAQDKLYKAQEPRMNVLSRKKDLERRRANSDRANQLIVQNGYIPTNTAERLEAHETTMKNIWKQVEDRINGGQEIMVDLSQIADVLDEYIQSQRDTKSTLTEGDLAKLEKESQALRGQQVSLPVAERLKQLYNAVINNRGEEKASDTMANGLQKATHEIGVIEDNLLSEIPGEFQGLKNDFGTLKDTYEDVFKADMKNQRKKGSGLTETYSRIEGIGDIANGLLGVATGKGDLSSIGKGAAKFLVGKSLAKASDVDFLVEQGFKELAAEMNKSQASSKTAKYQVADDNMPAQDNTGRKLSKGQQEYFKGSKVVDKDGNLLRVYHGTRGGDFTVFKKGNSWSNNLAKVGYWFTPNKEGALKFAESSWGGDAKPRAEEVYLDIKNPKIYEPSEFNLLKNEERNVKIDEQRKIYNQKADKADGLDYTKAGGFFHDEFDHPYYERQIFQDLKRSWEYDRKYDSKYGKYDPEQYRKLAEEYNRNYDANLDYDKILKDFEEYTKAKLDEEKEYSKLLDIKHSDPYDDFMYDIYKIDSNYDNKWTKDDLNMALNDYDSPNKFVEKLKSEGYDGIIIKGTEYDGEVIGGGARNDQYVAFDSNQIKRITNENPTKNEDIRYQKYGVAGKKEKGISATEGLNIRNFKNGKSVQELANQYGIDTKIVDSISTPEGQRAYGMYGDRLITLSKDLKESTVPHELLHAVFDIVDSKRRTSILEGIQKKLNVDNVQAEERLADNFSEYYRTGKFGTQGLAKTFIEKVKQFFYQIKKYIDGTYANEKQIRQLFNDIIDGKIEGEYGVYSDPKFQSVWHGSSADFERFDSSHMGEGEGAQAHGWGHYVAKEERTGRHYAELKERDSLPYEYDGKLYRDIVREENTSSDMYTRRKLGEITSLIGEMAESDGSKTFKELLDTRKKFINKVLQNDMETLAKKSKGEEQYVIDNLNQFIENDKELLGILDEIDVDKIKEVDLPKNRNLYEVEIPDPIKKDTPTGSNYFEEDGVYGRNELDKIIKALEDYEPIKEIEKGEDLPRGNNIREDQAKRNAMAYLKADKLDGEGVYLSLSEYLGGDKQASKFLESLGYDGIHYFGGRDGEAYVIFNDDALEIKNHEKY